MTRPGTMALLAALAVTAPGCGAPAADPNGPHAPTKQAVSNSAGAPAGSPLVLDAAGAGVPSYLTSDAKLVPASGAASSPAGNRASRTFGVPAPLGDYKRLALAPDGSFAIAADYGKLARLDPVTGKALWTREMRDIEAVAMAPPGDAFALAAGDQVLWLRASDGSLVRELAKRADLRAEAVAVSPDGKRVAFTDHGAGRLRVVEAATGREVIAVGGVHDAEALRFSPDGARLCAARYGTLRVWDLATGHAILVEHGPDLRGCAFVDAATVVTGGGGVVEAREIEPGGARTRLVLPGDWRVLGVDVIPGTRQVVVTHTGPYLSLVDLALRKEVARFEGEHAAASVSPDGALLVGFGGSGGAAAFRVRELAPVVPTAGHRGPVKAVAATKDHVVTGGDDGAVIVWNASTRAPEARLFGHVRGVASVALGAGGHVAFGGSRGQAYLVDPDLRTVRARFEIGEDETNVAFSPDGKHLIVAPSGSDRKYSDVAFLVDVATAAVRARFEGVSWSSFAFDPAREIMVAGPKPIRVVHLPTGAELRGASTYIGDGGLWVGISGRHLIAAQTGNRDSFWALGAPKSAVDIVSWPSVFSPGGALFATGRNDHVLVASTASGAEIAKLPVFPAVHGPMDDSQEKGDVVTALAFSADGASIVAGYRSGVARAFTAPARPAAGDELFGASTRDLVGLADLSTISPKAITGAGATIVSEPVRHVRSPIRGRLLVSPDGERAAISGPYEASLALVRTTDGTTLRTVEVVHQVASAVFAGDGRLLVLGRGSGSDPARARLFAVDPTKDEDVGSGECRWAALAGKKDLVCLGSRSLVLRGGREVGSPLSYTSSDVAAATSDGALVAQSTDTGARLVEVDFTGLREKRKLRGLLGSADALAFAPGGKLVAAAGDGAAVLYDAVTGAVLRVLEGQRKITALAFSPDAKLLATAAADRTVRVWDTATGDLKVIVRSRWEVKDGAGFAKDGKTLLTLGDAHLVFWKLP